MSWCMCDYLLKWHQELFGMSQKRHIDRLVAWTEIQTMNIRTWRQFFLVLIKRSRVFTSSWHFPWRFPLSACRMMRCVSWLEVAWGVSTTTTLIDLRPDRHFAWLARGKLSYSNSAVGYTIYMHTYGHIAPWLVSNCPWLKCSLIVEVVDIDRAHKCCGLFWESWEDTLLADSKRKKKQ